LSEVVVLETVEVRSPTKYLNIFFRNLSFAGCIDEILRQDGLFMRWMEGIGWIRMDKEERE
jgi:hypothetical protein